MLVVKKKFLYNSQEEELKIYHYSQKMFINSYLSIFFPNSIEKY